MDNYNLTAHCQFVGKVTAELLVMLRRIGGAVNGFAWLLVTVDERTHFGGMANQSVKARSSSPYASYFIWN